jgi:hypothetical protein
MPAQTVIKLRRGTAAQWTSANPVLAAGEIGIETDTQRSKYGDGTTAWASLSYTVADTSGVASVDWTAITSKPTEFPAEPHAASHELGGSDEIEIAPSQVTGTAIVEGDARLTDARTPTAHATSHEVGGSDEIEIAPSQVTGTAIVEGDARLTDARTPTAHAASHELGGSDEIEIAPSQVTGTAIVEGDARLTDTRTPTDGSVTEAKIASSAVTETKIADSAVTNAKIAGVDASKVSGTTLVVDRLRGVGTGGMSLTSTTHGLQVGATDAGNLAFDGNDIQARSDGAAGDISINRLGGDVDVGTTTRGFGIEGTKVWANGIYGNVLTTSFRSMYVSNTDTRNKLGYVSSSRETKKNIEPLAYTVEQILSIEPFQYNYNAEEDGQPKHAGFIAEDLHDAGLTGFVSYDDGKPATVNYEFYVVALQQVIKDQEARLKDLEQRISNLEK